jgi:predicted transcriptional regulator of viral defense system
MSRPKRPFPSGPRTREVYEVIEKLGTVKVSDIWDATGINPNTIRNSVRLLTINGLVERVEKGTYKVKSR